MNKENLKEAAGVIIVTSQPRNDIRLTYIDLMWTRFFSSGASVPPRQRSFKFLHIGYIKLNKNAMTAIVY